LSAFLLTKSRFLRSSSSKSKSSIVSRTNLLSKSIKSSLRALDLALASSGLLEELLEVVFLIFKAFSTLVLAILFSFNDSFLLLPARVLRAVLGSDIISSVAIKD
jgi:hypothetical protein